MLIGEAVQGPVWLWRLNPTGGVAASSGFSLPVVARVAGPGLSEAASGCLAVCPAERNPFHSALGQPLPMMSTDLSPWLGTRWGLTSQRKSKERRKQEEDRGGSLQARQGKAGREIHCWSYLKREPRR